MYSKQGKDIIQDMMVGLNNNLDELSSMNARHQEAERKAWFKNICKAIQKWYNAQDWSAHGHKTATVLLITWIVIFRIILVLAILAPALFLLSYATIQFEFVTTIRPEFVNKWIQTLDKTTWPQIFQPNTGHPWVLGIIWITSVIAGLTGFLLGLKSVFMIAKDGFLGCFRDEWGDINKSSILSFVLSLLVASTIIYSWNNYEILVKPLGAIVGIAFVCLLFWGQTNSDGSYSGGGSSSSYNDDHAERQAREQASIDERQRASSEMLERQKREREADEQLRTTIATAKQFGFCVNVYNAKGNIIFTVPGKLRGWTSQTVTVANKNFLNTYDNKGHQIMTQIE